MAGRSIGYGLLSLGLVAYVALLTPHRQTQRSADHWEYERAIVALTHDLHEPGNPTYAIDTPSIRYSPYTVGLALICRSTGLSAYDAMTIAGIVNTALFALSVMLLLAAFGYGSHSIVVLALMLFMWSDVPGYANTFAIADMPWHQVNPPALAFPLVLLMWTIHRWLVGRGRAGLLVWPIAVLLGTLVTLLHPPTGVFGLGGIALIALVFSGPGPRRWLTLGLWTAAVVVIFLLCVKWPWFDFLEASIHRRNDYYFRQGTLTYLVFDVVGPVYVFGLLGIAYRRRRLGRFCLVGAAGCFAMMLSAFFTQSLLFLRMGMVGMVFVHILLGMFVVETGLLRPATWRSRIRSLLSGDGARLARATLEVMLAAFLVLCATQQFMQTARRSHARILELLGREAPKESVREGFCRILEPIRRGDVVLSDRFTSWAIPSFGGRIVEGLHPEFFVPNRMKRRRDLAAFFESGDLSVQSEILTSYAVDWILLNPLRITRLEFDELVEPGAVVHRHAGRVLMDARRWLELRRER